VTVVPACTARKSWIHQRDDRDVCRMTLFSFLLQMHEADGDIYVRGRNYDYYTVETRAHARTDQNLADVVRIPAPWDAKPSPSEPLVTTASAVYHTYCATTS